MATPKTPTAKTEIASDDGCAPKALKAPASAKAPVKTAAERGVQRGPASPHHVRYR
jgi:hypothetical protein